MVATIDGSLPPGETTLWRFMDFTKYVSMLNRRALFFARADQLPDPFEGLYSRARPGWLPPERGDENHGDEDMAEARRRVCLSCWHENEHESAAMWRIYLSYEHGIALRSSVARLRAALEPARETVHIGQVRYVDDGEDPADAGGPDEIAAFFHKRKNFDYEREVRALLRAERPPRNAGCYVDAPLEELIDQVVVAPTAESWFEELVHSVTEKFGYRLAISASTMRDPPRQR
jgi:hypothetical protein